MHIAHLADAKLLTVEQLSKLVGLKRRQIAYLAKSGEIPGAVRVNGYHFQYPISPKLIEWIETKRSKVVAARKRPARSKGPNKNSGVINVHGISFEFGIWLRRVNGLEGILKMQREVQREIRDQIKPIARLYIELTRRLGS